MKLLDLINASFLERIQSLFASYLGTSLMITDVHGTPLIRPISGVRMCSLIRNTPRGEILCETSDRHGGQDTLLSKETHVYRCLAGFIDFSSAIVFGGEVIGMLVGGQVKTGDEDPASLKTISGDTSVALGDLEEAYREMPCVSEEELRRKLSFLKQVMEYLCDLTFRYYDQHLRDTKAVADANARVKAAEDVTELFNKQLKRISDTFLTQTEAGKDAAGIREELEEMLHQAGAVREVISESPEYQGCADKGYRIREVTYELQWILRRVSASYGDRVSVPEEIDGHIPPYLCGDPDAISEVLSRILVFLTKKRPEKKVRISLGMKKDQYAALLSIHVACPGLRLPEKEVSMITEALDGRWEALLGSSRLEYLEITTASAVTKKLSAELHCDNDGPDGFCFDFAVPQLPAKGGFY